MGKRLIENFRDFNSGESVKKTIMNIFICEYSYPLWEECVSIFKSLSFPTSVQISGAHHRGLAFQILLDINLKESIELSNNIINKFPKEPLIVISEVMVKMKDSPIGWYQDNDLVGPGRYFDQLVKEGKTGLFIFE